MYELTRESTPPARVRLVYNLQFQFGPAADDNPARFYNKVADRQDHACGVTSEVAEDPDD